MATTRIAFLGLGAMGRRMATRLVDAGHDVVVWSRAGVPTEAMALRERVAASPRAAAQDAEVVIAMVTDDEASRAVWTDARTGALVGLRPGAIAIECSTITPAWARALAARVGEAGAAWLESPVMGSRPQAEAGSLVCLVGAEAAVVERARPVLAAFGNTVVHVGPAGAGATVKLIANALFGAQVVLVAELLAFAGRAGLDAAAVAEALRQLPVMSPAASAAAAGMLAESFAPLFPTRLAAKDLRYALATAEAAGAEVPLVRGVETILAEAVARGLGEEHLTAVSKLYRERHAALTVR